MTGVQPQTPDAATSGGRDVRLWAWVLGAYTILGLIRMGWGLVTADEGWYLLTARQLLAGQIPYRDFLFTQMPLVPLAWALPSAVLGPSILVARVCSFLLGGFGIVLVVDAARRLGGRLAAVLAGLLLVPNLSIVLDLTRPRTQPLTFFLVSALLWTLSFERWRKRHVVAGIGLATLGVLTRLSMLPLVPLVVYRLWRGAPTQHRSIAVAAGVVAAAMAVLGHLLWADGNLLFGVYTFHSEFYGWPKLAYGVNGAFVKECLANQFPILLAWVWSAFLLRKTIRESGGTDAQALTFAGEACLATTLIHLSRPIAYAAYQTPTAPLAVFFAAVVLARWARANAIETTVRNGAIVLALLAMPTQEFMVTSGAGGTMQRTAEAAKLVHEAAGHAHASLLTPEADLVLASNSSVPNGYEMGWFGYFPSMDDARAARLHVVNRNRLREDLRTERADVIAITDDMLRWWSATFGGDVLRTLLTEHYASVGQVVDFGQYRRKLFVWRARRLLRQPP
jgi:hypothetical protein